MLLFPCGVVLARKSEICFCVSWVFCKNSLLNSVVVSANRAIFMFWVSGKFSRKKWM